MSCDPARQCGGTFTVGRVVRVLPREVGSQLAPHRSRSGACRRCMCSGASTTSTAAS